MEHKVLKSEEDAIRFIKSQDLTKYGVGMGARGTMHLDGWVWSPYSITGYFYDKETLSFPRICTFEIAGKWGNESDAENCIRRIREAIQNG